MDETLVLELSSDEELGMENSSSTGDFDWLTKLFEDDPPDCNNNNSSINPNNCNNKDNDDDVVVVGEVIVEKSKKIKSFDDNDDDCVVLDCDPHKVKDEGVKDCKIDKNDGNFVKDDGDCDDDLVIVGEKGQVACRDFPHARHSCAKYPFSSTAHEKSCNMCHCYVCDSLAPCAHWGSGASITDHCHATDKEEYWKLERTRLRQLKNPSPLPMAATKRSDSSLNQSSQSHQHYRVNQLLRCSINSGISSTSYPRYISRSQRSSVPIASNNFQPNLISRQLLRCVNNGNTQVQGNRDASVLPRTRIVSSRPIFKRSGVRIRPVTAEYNNAFQSPNNVSVACLHVSNQQLPGQLTENNSINSTVSSLHSELNSACLPSSASNMYPATFLNLQGYGQPSPHTPTSQYHDYDHSAGLANDSNSSTYAPINQSHNVLGLALPFHSEQHSAVMQNVSCPTPDGPSSTTQCSYSAEQNCYSPVFSSAMTNVWNSDTPSCQQSTVESSVVQGAVPVHELLPSIEQNEPPSDNVSEPSLFYDMDYWLQDNGPVIGSREEYFMFGVNNQASRPEPVDTGMLYFDFETSMQGLTHS